MGLKNLIQQSIHNLYTTYHSLPKWTSHPWSPHCFKNCFQLPQPTTTAIAISSTIIEVPEEYKAFQDVFSKQAATKIPPHQPWTPLFYITGTQSLSWNLSATEAFEHQKEAFCHTPTLAKSQLTFHRQSGCLHQWSEGDPPKLHLCATFSKKLSLAEQN